MRVPGTSNAKSAPNACTGVRAPTRGSRSCSSNARTAAADGRAIALAGFEHGGDAPACGVARLGPDARAQPRDGSRRWAALCLCSTRARLATPAILPSTGPATRIDRGGGARERDARDDVGDAGRALHGQQFGHRRGGESHSPRTGIGASQVGDAIARVRRAPSEMSRPPAAIAAATLSVAPRLRPAVCVASDSRSHVASGRRSAHLRRQALREHDAVANAGNDADARPARLRIARQRCAEVFDLAVDVQIRAARVEAGGSHRRAGQRVRTGGEQHTTHAGQRRTERRAVIERQRQRAQAGRLSERRELRAVASGEQRPMTAAQGFVENQTSGGAVRAVEHPIGSRGYRHRSLPVLIRCSSSWLAIANPDAKKIYAATPRNNRTRSAFHRTAGPGITPTWSMRATSASVP